MLKRGAERDLDVSRTLQQDLGQFRDDRLPEILPYGGDYLQELQGVGARDYGLTRRYHPARPVWCMSKISFSVGPRSGLSTTVIDGSNLAEIDFRRAC
jgi:hypothetical protein